MKNKFIIFNILFIFILIGTFKRSLAQPEFNIAEIRLANKNASAVYLTYKEHLNISIEDSKLKLISNNQTDLLYLDEQAKGFATKSIFFTNTFEEINDIKALTYVPDGKKFRKLEVKEINERKPVSNGVFYDDSKEKYFIFPGAQPGAVSSLTYEQVYKEPRFLSSFYFDSYLPIEDAEYSITFPKEVKLKFRLYGDTSLIKFESTTSKNKTTFTWKAKKMKAAEFESDAPSFQYYATQIIPYIDSYTINNEKVELLSDPSSLYKWYASLIKDVNLKSDPAVKHIVDSLTSGIKSDDDKIKRIFYWVQDNIKYVAWEDGLGGFVPRQAGEVLFRRYGDCKDMASLTSNMLNLAGFDAHLTWIGTRRLPYKYAEVPTPLVDNHMICAINRDNKWIYLDATSNACPYGEPSIHIQGKEALIGFDAEKFKIEKVPVPEAIKNTIVDSVFLSVTENSLNGSGHRIVTGMAKTDLKEKMYGISINKRIESFTGQLQFGNNKCKTDSVTYTGYENRDEELTIRFQTKLNDYLTKVDNTVYVNLNLDKIWQTSLIDTSKRKLDVENDFKIIHKKIYVLKIPDGYKVSKTPLNSNFSTDEFGFDISYILSGNNIILTKTLTTNYLILPALKFYKWNEMISKLNEAYKKVVELEKL